MSEIRPVEAMCGSSQAKTATEAYKNFQKPILKKPEEKMSEEKTFGPRVIDSVDRQATK
jgi:hypothetical protein